MPKITQLFFGLGIALQAALFPWLTLRPVWRDNQTLLLGLIGLAISLGLTYTHWHSLWWLGLSSLFAILLAGLQPRLLPLLLVQLVLTWLLTTQKMQTPTLLSLVFGQMLLAQLIWFFALVHSLPIYNLIDLGLIYLAALIMLWQPRLPRWGYALLGLAVLSLGYGLQRLNLGAIIGMAIIFLLLAFPKKSLAPWVYNVLPVLLSVFMIVARSQG
ncbi:hypothetical protein [Lacticaseibacillus brantae]|uniref:Uncharacterized protein n=1 Tax=Lacticaseibacillus brantae DSM 23927 TaxID=1423727 RepID=A0A0R2AY48_9LACO|nr:hypothetical protein [Lacticaseibacillus brantae]KRM72301.1 hypothetical protein FC34_GL000001 [Lacticaseibacillus brantae DSM 23927]